MAQTANKLPIKTEGRGAAAPSLLPEWRPFENLRRDIDQLFDNFHVGFSRTPAMPTLFGVRGTSAPAVDFAEHDKAYEVTAELPGLDAADIDVRFAHDMLTISGEKKEEKEEKKKDYYLSERRYGSFQRTFQLPEGIDPNKIEAKFEKGVLKITLPKTEKAQNHEKKIAVTTK
jgi:HSP20 family protein